MKTVVSVKLWAGLAAAFAIALTAGVATAHGDVDVDRGPNERSRHGPGAISDAKAHGEGKDESERDTFTASVDLVLGWGKVPFAVQNLPSIETRAITYTYSDATPSAVQSFVLAGSVCVAKHLWIAARLPATFASFSPTGSPSRSTTSFGNVELEAEYGADDAEGLSLRGALGVALPTAQGEEIPPDLLGRDASTVDQGAYDRFSLSRAAALARGDEDNALFELKRLALVPKVALLYRRRALRIEPSLKIENLIATTSSLHAPYVGEIIPALRVAWAMGRGVELGLRGWANVRFAAARGERETSAAVEPGIVLRVGPFEPYAGLIVPLAGPPWERAFFGVRIGVSGSL